MTNKKYYVKISWILLILESPLVLAGFAATDFLTPARIAGLRNHFGSLERAWQCKDVKAFEQAGITKRSAQIFLDKTQQIDAAKVLEQITKANAKIVFYEDDDYPQRLRTIDAPPVILLVRGALAAADGISLSVVGTRRISVAGRQMTEKLVPALVRSGLAIVSGLARGVDAVAHSETIKSGGKTIAVLGNGIDQIYPSENRSLADKIVASGGAIISEFCPGVPPNAFHFPRRNRIVAGISLGTLVIEGAEKSGSLITAQFALEQGREVFAVPGSPAVPMAMGPNRLIQNGTAKLVMDAEDILNELPLELKRSQEQLQRTVPTDPIEKSIYELLDHEPRLFDEIVRTSELQPAQFSAMLTILEMKGFVVNYGGNRWARK